MIKINGIFTLRLFARNSNKLESLTLTLQNTLMSLFMTTIQQVTKANDGQLEIDFEIPVENIVIEKGKYRIRLTGSGETFNHIALISQLEQGDRIAFSAYAETESNSKFEIKVKFALFKEVLSQQTTSSIH